MGTLCNLNLVIFKCFYYQSEKIVAGDINSLNLLVSYDLLNAHLASLIN